MAEILYAKLLTYRFDNNIVKVQYHAAHLGKQGPKGIA